MHTEAATSQAALTGSPRVSATTANEIAPSTATPAHNSFAWIVIASLPCIGLQPQAVSQGLVPWLTAMEVINFVR
jgi:hypothetical protein